MNAVPSLGEGGEEEGNKKCTIAAHQFEYGTSVILIVWVPWFPCNVFALQYRQQNLQRLFTERSYLVQKKEVLSFRSFLYDILWVCFFFPHLIYFCLFSL